MGLLSPIIKLVIKGGVVLVGTAFIAQFTLFLFSFTPFPKELIVLAQMLVMGCIALTLTILVFTRNTEAVKWPLRIAGIITGGITGAGLLILLTLKASQQNLILVASLVTAAVIVLYTDSEVFRTNDLKDRSEVAAFEVTEIPRVYLKAPSQISPHSQPMIDHAKPFQHLLQNAANSDIPLGFRITRTRGHIRLFFFTWAATADLLANRRNSLHTFLSSHLPHFTVKPIPQLPTSHIPTADFAAVYLTGEPSFDSNGAGVTALGEALLSTPLEINEIYQVFVTPQKPSRIERWFTKRRFNKLSHFTRYALQHGKDQHRRQPQSMGDVDELVKAERIKRRLDRLSTRRVLDVQVSVACWYYQIIQGNGNTEDVAHTHLGVLSSALQAADPEKDFKIRSIRGLNGRLSQRLLRGNPTGASTLLLPQEAAAFFMPPRCDVGIQVSERQFFSTAPQQPPSTDYGSGGISAEDGVDIGAILDIKGQPTPHRLVIEPVEYTGHDIYIGLTKSGKTNSVFDKLLQLWNKFKIPFLIIVPAKSDCYKLFHSMPSLRYFKAGNNKMPVRFNFFHVPQVVSVRRRIGSITNCFLTSWPSPGALKIQLKLIFQRVYEKCGWDPDTGEHGRPILLEDFYAAAMERGKELRYDIRTNQEFIGAFTTRVEDLLLDSSLAGIFNTREGLTIPNLLSHPTVIDLSDLPDEMKCLVTALIATGIAEYREAMKARHPDKVPKGLLHCLVIEEASNVLRSPSLGAGRDEGNSAQLEAIESIAKLLRTARDAGQGITIVNQSAKNLSELVVGLASITFIHNLKDPRDQEIMGRQANCSEEEVRLIGDLRVGEAIVHRAMRGRAVRVQVNKCPVTDAPDLSTGQVEERMQAFFTANPQFYTYEKPKRLEDIVLHESPQPVASSGLDEGIIKQLCIAVSRPKFRRIYTGLLDEAAEKGDESSLKRILLFVQHFARKYLSDNEKEGDYLIALLNYLRVQFNRPRYARIFEELSNSL